MKKQEHRPIHTALREAISKQGLTQARLCRALGIPRSTMCHYTNGRFEPPAEMKRKIAAYLRRPMSSLWPKS